MLSQGAEARIFALSLCGRPAIAKERFRKRYRHPTLDDKLRSTRCVAEARCLARCRKAGLDTPVLMLVDVPNATLFMEHIEGGATVKEHLRALYRPPAASLGAIAKGGFDPDDPDSEDGEDCGGGGDT